MAALAIRRNSHCLVSIYKVILGPLYLYICNLIVQKSAVPSPFHSGDFLLPSVPFARTEKAFVYFVPFGWNVLQIDWKLSIFESFQTDTEDNCA